MRRAEKEQRRRYRGRRPRGGLSAEQAGVVVLAVLVAMLVMTMKVNSQYCGMSVSEQVHQAVFVTKDWE